MFFGGCLNSLNVVCMYVREYVRVCNSPVSAVIFMLHKYYFCVLTSILSASCGEQQPFLAQFPITASEQ